VISFDSELMIFVRPSATTTLRVHEGLADDGVRIVLVHDVPDGVGA
jgi:hypothetical protein